VTTNFRKTNGRQKTEAQKGPADERE